MRNKVQYAGMEADGGWVGGWVYVHYCCIPSSSYYTLYPCAFSTCVHMRYAMWSANCNESMLLYYSLKADTQCVTSGAAEAIGLGH